MVDEPAPLDAATFCDVFVEFFRLSDRNSVSPDSDLRTDLGFDSIQILEVALFLEEVGDHELPDEILARLLTVRDVWDTYVLYRAHTRRPTA
jgi:acyl carrier protein